MLKVFKYPMRFPQLTWNIFSSEPFLIGIVDPDLTKSQPWPLKHDKLGSNTIPEEKE